MKTAFSVSQSKPQGNPMQLDSRAHPPFFMLGGVSFSRWPHVRPAFVLTAGLTALLLGSCAPRTADPGKAQAATSVNAVTFYPAQAGLSWTYVPEGEALNSAPYTLAVLGPTLFGDQAAVAYRFSGRGADQTSFRQVGDGGSLLLGFTKPGLTVSLTPPWREYPAANAWRVGLNWSGESQVSVLSDGKVVQEGQAQYRYTVLEKRRVSVGASARDVWVVNRQISDNVGGLFPSASQNLWYEPFGWEIRTPEGLLQVGRNYRAN